MKALWLWGPVRTRLGTSSFEIGVRHGSDGLIQVLGNVGMDEMSIERTRSQSMPSCGMSFTSGL